MPAPFTFALCADDYAMTHGISRGILEALDAGALTATSVMTTSAIWPDAAAPLRRHAGRADIGLHLNLTLGPPLGPMPILAPDGRLPGVGTLIKAAGLGRLPRAEIAAEIERQCQRFVDVFGAPPDHVDGHQHVQAIAPIRALLLEGLARRGWRPWVRCSADRPWRILARGGAVRKALTVAVLGRGFAAAARAKGVLTNDSFAGFSPFDPRADYAAQFDGALASPGRRHLVMCHPGYADDALRALDPVVETREVELAFLLSTEFRRRLDARNASLARGSIAWTAVPMPGSRLD